MLMLARNLLFKKSPLNTVVLQGFASVKPASTEEAYVTESRLDYIRRQKEKVGAKDLIGPSSRRTTYMNERRHQPVFHDVYMLDHRQIGWRYEPDGSFSSIDFEKRLLDRTNDILVAIEENVSYGLQDMKKWIEQQVEQTKTSGKSLSSKDQQRLEELAEKVLKMDQEKFNKEGEKLIKEMITIKQRAQ